MTAHLAPDTARRVRAALAAALREVGEDPGPCTPRFLTPRILTPRVPGAFLHRAGIRALSAKLQICKFR